MASTTFSIKTDAKQLIQDLDLLKRYAENVNSVFARLSSIVECEEAIVSGTMDEQTAKLTGEILVRVVLCDSLQALCGEIRSGTHGSLILQDVAPDKPT